jgi:hypothetical protein
LLKRSDELLLHIRFRELRAVEKESQRDTTTREIRAERELLKKEK